MIMAYLIIQYYYQMNIILFDIKKKCLKYQLFL